ncbi:MAG: di-heme oxidoredictase family protein [Pseudomonadota bacterium]
MVAWGGHQQGLTQSIVRERTDLSAKDDQRVQAITKPTEDFSQAESFETMQGGAATSRKMINRDAFSNPSANLTFEEEEKFRLGNALFRKLWVTSPSSTHASDGLGPIFNARSCQSCHIKDGRGHPPLGRQDSRSMFLRLARGAITDQERQDLAQGKVLNFPDPVYGHQLQDLAVPGLRSEGRMVVSYTQHPIELADGTIITLRKPKYQISNLAYGPLHPKTTLSPRVANQMIGLGLIEAIHPSDIMALADPDDEDGDGISGRPALVYDKKTSEITLGRFGWKAQNASIRTQSAEAFAGDIGISTPDLPNSFGDCTQAQEACLSFPTGVQNHLGDTEAPDPILDLVVFYAQNLAVPARRDVDDPMVLRGKQLFYQSSCATCHTPKFVTRRDSENPAQSFQLIWPYSDFLLHDMGEGLADGQSVGVADGQEWRTPPLWGIGLTQTVSGHTFFLHDGRARNLIEAILWHGGEAEEARESFRNLNENDRRALIRFLESL